MVLLDILCSLPRTLCPLLSGHRRPDNTDAVDNMLLAERNLVSTKLADPRRCLAYLQTARNSTEKDSTQKALAFGVTRCAMSPQDEKCSAKVDFDNHLSWSSVSSTRIGDQIDVPQLYLNTKDEELNPQSADVDLLRNLFFYDSAEPDSLGNNRKLMCAIRLQGRPNAAIHVIGVPGGSRSNQELLEVNSGPEKLMVDVRINSHDDPRLLHIIGAQLNMGTITRLYFSSTCPTPLCEITSSEETGHSCVLLEHAIEEMYDLEKDRQNKEMMIYQRQVCAMMMRSQRQRYLRLQTQ